MTVTRPSCASAISVLVPMSMAIVGRLRDASRVAAMTASASEPTKPAMGGGKWTPRLGVHVEAELGGAQRQRLGGGRGERRGAETHRRQAQRQVVHGGVADHASCRDLPRLDALTLAQSAPGRR